MSIRALLFDFGGTLDSNGAAWLERFRPIYLEHGIRATREEFAKAFYASDDGLSSRFRLGGLGLEETLLLQVRCVLETLGRTDVPAEAVARSFLMEARAGIQRSRSLLRRLKPSFRLGVVSNFYGNLESVLAGEGLLDLFDAVADSSAVGSLKPEPGIFLHALRALGAEPGSTCMVGDSIPRDMRGAEGLGMAHAWLRGDRPASPSCCPRALVLDSLEALEAGLGTLPAGAAA